MRRTVKPCPCIAACITLRVVTHVVNLAVDLDREPPRKAGKIERDVANRMLAAELVAAGSLPQFTPQQHFGQVAAAALAFCGFEGLVAGG